MLDHLAYGTPDLEKAARELGDALGIKPLPGGQHIGQGTRNYLLPLEGGSYLELIGRDPDQEDFTGVRPFGLNDLTQPRLAAWAIRVEGIERRVAEARAKGYDPGSIRSMSRRRPDGSLLSWRLTDPIGNAVPILIPFLIEWGTASHPSATSGPRARLIEFRVESPDPEPVRQALAALGVEAPVDGGPRNRLRARIAGPAGESVLD